MKSLSLAFAFSLVLGLMAQAKTNPGLELYPYGEKVGLAGTPLADGKVDLEMARAEYELFSVTLPSAVKATVKATEKASAKATTKSTRKVPQAAGAWISNPHIEWESPAPKVQFETYFLATHRLTSSSYKAAFVPGEVADIPVPLEWLQKNELTLPEENQPAKPAYLFEVMTLAETTPGDYRGSLTFVWNKQNYKIPLRLKVYKTVLPKQFDLETSFGFAPWDVLKKHYGKWHKDNMTLYATYLKAALEHRIDFHKLYVKYPQENAKDPLAEGPVHEQTFLGQTEGLFNGALNPFGFQMKITDLPVPLEYKKIKNSKIPHEKLEAFWKNLNATVLAHDLKERSFVYFVDEPKKEDLESLGEDLRTIRKWAPDLRFLVTNPYRSSLEGAVNMWCVGLSNLDRPTEKPSEFYTQRADLPEKTKNEKFWIYVGCNAHGCSGPEDPGTPDLMIDRASAYQRAFPWMALRYKAQGILYYDTVYGYSKGTPQSPWKDAFSFTGYGEGNLFYPCTPTLGECKDPRVISALRLKILRDGLEDVQIMKMAMAVSPAAATSLTEDLNKLVVSVKDFKKTNEDYEKLKRKALGLLDSVKTPSTK